MNHQDPRDENGHLSMNQRLEQYGRSIRQGLAGVQSWLAIQKDRLAARFKPSAGNGDGSARLQRSTIRPKRVEPNQPDLIASRPTTVPGRPALKRIDATEPARDSIQEKSLDDEPDRTYEKNAHADRPDLRHVTRGEPELMDDTAVHPVINDSMLTELPVDTAAASEITPSTTRPPASAVKPAAAPTALSSDLTEDMQSDQTEDLDKTAVHPMVRNRSAKAITPSALPPLPVRTAASVQKTDQTGPVRSFLEKHFPDLLQFLDSYQKRRKADRSIRRNSRERVYRLKGYTTVEKINRKRQSEKRQRLLRRALISIIALLTLILLFQLYNPFKDLTEWYRILGVDSFSELIETQSSTGASNPTSSFQTVITSPTTSGARTSPAASVQTSATTKAATTTTRSATTTRR